MSEFVQLREITQVYRFGINLRSWERTTSVSDHFIAYKLYGNTTHESGGQIWEFSKDMIMVANCVDTYKVTQHEFGSEGRRGGCIAVHFTTNTAFPFHLATYSALSHPQIKGDFFRILDSWEHFTKDNSLAAKYACFSLFYGILSRLVMMTNESHEIIQNKRAVSAKTFIERNYANSSLSLLDVAANESISQRRLSDLFYQEYQETLWHFLTRVRMQAATSLLRNKQLPIADVAAMTGYASPSYFSRVFRNEMGLSPATFRSRLS